MVSWTTMGFSMGLRSIEVAYQSSRDAFERDLENDNTEWRQKISSEREHTGDTDYSGQYEDYLSDLAFDAETGLRLIREAFLLTLYHYWEKEISSLLRIKRGDHKAICNKIKADGRLQLDEPEISRLHLIANTIKHNWGYPLYLLEPGLFSNEAQWLDEDDRFGWHNFLRMKEEDVRRAIAAVQTSGPGSEWKDNSSIILKEDDVE